MTIDSYAKNYYKRHGTLLLLDKKDISYNNLKKHFAELREQYVNGTLPQETKELYDEMGMVWHEADLESAKWNYCYGLAEQYYNMFGTLDMPKSFSMNGVMLNNWLETQLDAYRNNEMSLRRATKLESIGVRWNKRNADRISFSEKSIAYYVAKALPEVISSYRPEALQGKELDVYIPSLKIGIEYDGGHFHNDSETRRKDELKNRLCAMADIKLIRVRDKAASRMESDDNCTVIHRHSNSMSDLKETIEKVFESIGIETKNIPDINLQRDKYNIFNDMIEEKTYFNQYLMAAKHYYKDNGHLFVPKKYVDPTGIKLGKWIDTMRNSVQYLSEQQVNALDDIGMVWKDVEREKWLYNFSLVKQCDIIEESDTTFDGKSLQAWLNKQLDAFDNYELYEDYQLTAIKEYKEKQQSREETRKPKAHSKSDDFEI